VEEELPDDVIAAALAEQEYAVGGWWLCYVVMCRTATLLDRLRLGWRLTKNGTPRCVPASHVCVCFDCVSAGLRHRTDVRSAVVVAVEAKRRRANSQGYKSQPQALG